MRIMHSGDEGGEAHNLGSGLQLAREKKSEYKNTGYILKFKTKSAL